MNFNSVTVTFLVTFACIVCSPVSSDDDDTYGLHGSFYSCDHGQYLSSPRLPGVFFQWTPSGGYQAMPCPQGLVFDPTVCVCNYPHVYYASHLWK